MNGDLDRLRIDATCPTKFDCEHLEPIHRVLGEGLPMVASAFLPSVGPSRTIPSITPLRRARCFRRPIVNVITFCNSAILSRLLTMWQASDSDVAHADIANGLARPAHIPKHLPNRLGRAHHKARIGKVLPSQATFSFNRFRFPRLPPHTSDRRWLLVAWWRDFQMDSLEGTMDDKVYICHMNWNGTGQIREVELQGNAVSKAYDVDIGRKCALAFNISTDERSFIFSHSEDQSWQLKELTGRSEEHRPSSAGVLDDYYPNLIPLFHSSSEIFVGGQGRNTYKFGIYRIDISGDASVPVHLSKLSSSVAPWNDFYPSFFSYEMSGNAYISGQCRHRDYWFAQELRADGSLGREVASANWDVFYPTFFSYYIEGKPYIFGQTDWDANSQLTGPLASRYWFIQEVLSNGKPGKVLDGGNWNLFYPIAFPIYHDRKAYMYACATSGYWFLQELKSNGLGKVALSGYGERAPIIFPVGFQGKSGQQPFSGCWWSHYSF